MTAKTKWWIVAVLAVVLVLVPVGMVMLWSVVHGGLPVYTFQQTDSIHPGYRRTTITSGTKMYVQDFEEYPLRSVNREPTNAVGRSAFGGGKICAIEGQPTSAYVAVDCGSEMPAYEVFRSYLRPPFDWRRFQFQTLEFAANNSGVSSDSAARTIGLIDHKRTVDPAVIEDVLRTLREGTPASSPLPAAVTDRKICEVCLTSNELPGLMFCPQVYRDATGPVYLAESISVEFTNRTTRVHARWIAASALFTKWVQTP